MTDQRIGMGVDFHRFSERTDGRDLVLGGITIESELVLVGHSDGDALAHALGDAILGAAALGDLGSHFPDTDERFRGANSLELLSQCAELAAAEGWHLVNGDCTIVTEAPKIAPFRIEMMERLSASARGPVHVKATRPEGLGSLGRIEGLGCFAIALLGR